MGDKKETKERADPTSCPLAGCAHREGCAIIDITGKAPKPGGKCSYYEKEHTGRKKVNKNEGSNEL